MVTLPTYIEQPERASLTLVATLRRVFSFPVMLAFLLVTGCYVLAKDNILDPDTWWHIKVGQHILSTHSWPWTDTYSPTVSGTPWIAYEWLGEVAIGAAASIAGLRSATILLIVLCGAIAVLLYYYMTLKCASSKAAFVAAATVVPLLGAFFTLRPQLFGALFLILTLIILEKFRQDHAQALYFLPLMFLLWVNTHGSFVFGFFVVGIFWLSGQFEFTSGGLFSKRWTKRQSIQLLLSMLVSVVILPVTPYGSRLAAYPLSMALTQPINVKSIEEWRPLGPEMLLGKYFLGLVLLFFLACLMVRPTFRLAEVVLALSGVIAACIHLRFVLLFVIFFTPLWAIILSRWAPRYRPDDDHPVLNAVLIAAMLAGSIHYFPTLKDLDQRVAREYPGAALRYLSGHPVHGQFFNDYGWGGYLIWSDSPKNMIFIDGRADIYEYSGVLADYLGIARLAPNAFQLLNKYDVQALLLHQDSALATALNAMPGWERVYRDQLAAVYVRHSAGKPASMPQPKSE